jgi:hypothetical protein
MSAGQQLLTSGARNGIAITCALLIWVSAALAKPHEWKDATVLVKRDPLQVWVTERVRELVQLGSFR